MIETVCWFDHDGGPLILLPRESLPLWEGIDPPSAGRVVEAVSRWEDQETATDYDRACDVTAWAEALPVGVDSWGLVFPEDAGGISWLTRDDSPDSFTFALVQSLLFDTDALAAYRAVFDKAVQDPAGWTPLHDGLLVRDGDLLLMHAASRGDEVREVAWNRATQIGTAQMLRVSVGTYSVDQYTLTDGEENRAGPIFTRFQFRVTIFE